MRTCIFQVGGKRGHDLGEQSSLPPALGSGPEADGLGCGFFTVNAYRDILRRAKQLHIDVIPEIDLPGHARAAVKAMEARYHNYKAQGNKNKSKCNIFH